MLMLGRICNTINPLSVADYPQQIVKGVIFIIAVLTRRILN